MKDIKIAIIGGGAAGLGMAKSLAAAKYEFDLYEKEDDFGGNWYYGKPCSKMYKTTHLISSKLNTQFSDFPMPADYPQYPRHDQILKYLRSVAKKYNLYQYAKFNTKVIKLEFEEKRWKLYTDKGENKIYDFILVANGLYRKPHLPTIADEYKGKWIHSIDYKDPAQLKDKTILVVGGGNTGCDIVVDAVYSAKKVFHSMRRGYYFMPKFIDGLPTQEWLMSINKKFNSEKEFWNYVFETFKFIGYNPTDYGLPKPDYRLDQTYPVINSFLMPHYGQGDIIYKPNIKSVINEDIIFADESKEKVDLVVFATGYETDFSFLPNDIFTKNVLANLYMHMLSKKYDNIIFVGYLNVPTGIGNLLNMAGQLLVAYLKAWRKNSTNFQILREMKQGPEPNCGHERFIKTRRHSHEYDLWKFIKVLSKLTQKLEQGI